MSGTVTGPWCVSCLHALDLADPSHVLDPPTIKLQEDLLIEEQPIKIMDEKENVLRTKSILTVKVIWQNYGAEKAMWEPKILMIEHYPNFLIFFLNFEDKILL